MCKIWCKANFPRIIRTLDIDIYFAVAYSLTVMSSVIHILLIAHTTYLVLFVKQSNSINGEFIFDISESLPALDVTELFTNIILKSFLITTYSF